MKRTISLLLSVVMVLGVLFSTGLNAAAANTPSPTSVTGVNPRPAGFSVGWKKSSNADGYQIQYATKSNFSNGKTDTVSGGSVTSTVIRGRASEKRYYVRVRAYKGSAYSSWSAARSIVTGNYNEPFPTYIKKVTPLPASFGVLLNTVAEADGYEVKYATKSDFSNSKTNKYEGSANTDVVVGGRAANCRYYVQARAYRVVNGKTYYSAWGAINKVTTLSKYSVSAPSITKTVPDGNGFRVTVSAVSGAEGYQVRYATRSDFGNAKTDTFGASSTELKVGRRAYDTKYYVQARAYKTVSGAKYYSSWSAVKNVTTAKDSRYPSNTSIMGVEPDGNGFKVTVSAVSGVSGYQIRYATRSDFGNGKTDTFSGSATELKVGKRAYDTRYYVQARAYKTVGGVDYYSEWTSSKEVRTEKDPRYPDAVSISSLSPGDYSFTVKWNKASGASGYEIRFATKSDFSNAAVWTANADETSKKITGRAGGKKYYVQMRAYKNYSGKNYYTEWSAAKSVKTNDTYADELRKAGFPESYIDSLVTLHNKYPNWIFEPLKTGYDWNYAVNQERTPHSQQVDYLSAGDSVLCKDSSCYKDGHYVTYEGGTMAAASKASVEKYMDPRNWLNEEYIFQFESTAYDGKQTQAGVESILKGTWMYNSTISYKDKNGKTQTINKKYSEVILKAANDSGLSAYYLASKIRQEVGGAKPTAGGASGTNKTYPGIYNYYNIGAYTGYLDGLKWASTGGSEYYTNTDCNVRADATTNSAKVVYVPKGTKVTYEGMVDGKAPDAGYKWFKVTLSYGGKSYKGYIRADLVHSPYGRPWDTPEKSIYHGALWIAENYVSQYTGYLQKFNVNPDSPEPFAHEYMTYVRAAAQESSHSYRGYKDAGILSHTRTFIIPVFNNMPNK